MASIINASTSSGIVQTADTSGILQLQANGTTIATISSTGLSTQVGAPAFSAYKNNGNQSVSSSTFTKITFNAEVFDTNNNFSSSTFTPTVAGYYQINGSFSVEGLGTVSRFIISLYKNGSEYIRGNDLATTGNSAVISSLVYMNGTTDYIELYGFINGSGSIAFRGGSDGNLYTYFQGSMVRSA